MADERVERLLAQIDARLSEQGERQREALRLQRENFRLRGILRYYQAR